jgi:ribosomal protein L37E
VTDVIVLPFLLYDSSTVTVCRDAAEINLVKETALGRGGRGELKQRRRRRGRRQRRVTATAVASCGFASSRRMNGSLGIVRGPEQHPQRFADYFVVCGLDKDSGLEPDKYFGEW